MPTDENGNWTDEEIVENDQIACEKCGKIDDLSLALCCWCLRVLCKECYGEDVLWYDLTHSCEQCGKERRQKITTAEWIDEKTKWNS